MSFSTISCIFRRVSGYSAGCPTLATYLFLSLGWGCNFVRATSRRQLLHRRGLLRRQLPQHILQDAAVLEVLNLLRRIDADPGGELFHRSIGCNRFHGQIAAVSQSLLQEICQASERENLIASQPQ